MERPNIPPNCPERVFLGTANYVFTAVFTLEMVVKVSALNWNYDSVFIKYICVKSLRLLLLECFTEKTLTLIQVGTLWTDHW